MDIIQNAIKKRSRDVAMNLAGMMILLTYAFWRTVSESEGVNYIISCLVILIPTIVFFLSVFPRARGFIDFTKSKVWRELEKRGYADEFISTIDSELRDNCLLESEDGYDLNFFITQKWIVLISRNGSTIGKTEEISRMYNTTRSTIAIRFNDGSYFSGKCTGYPIEFIQMCKEVLPDINYERE